MAKSTSNTRPDPKREVRNASWQSTAVIGGSLLFGILLAVVHDRLYAHFSQRTVKSQTQQEWIGRIGTGLAFLIKTLFSAAVGGASVQLLWWTLKNRTTSLGTIDSALSVISNPLAANVDTLKEVPVIVLLAVICWWVVYFLNCFEISHGKLKSNNRQ
jgi:cellobiose-specific phosphotransferase system component IIC